MKIASLVIPIVLCLLMIIVPIFELVAFNNDLDFALYNETAMVITQAVLCFGSMIAILIMRPSYDWLGSIFWILLAPIGLLNALCFVVSEWEYSLIVAAIWVCSILAIYIKFIPDSIVKAASAVVSILTFITIVVVLLVFRLFLPQALPDEVRAEIGSPNGEYVADVMLSKSLTGEKTKIEVRKLNPDTRAVFGAYTKKPVKVYEGESHEIQTAAIAWKDDSTIIVNGNEYAVVFPE